MRRVVLEGPPGIRIACLVPERGRERTRGLMGRGRLAPDEGLLIPNASSVHTFGMRQTILVARLDRSFRVVDLRRLPPRRLLFPRRGARHVLECSPTVALRIGDMLRQVGGSGDGREG